MKEGVVSKAQYGTWALVEGASLAIPEVNIDLDFDEEEDEEVGDEEVADGLTPDKLIGGGSGSVYVYFNPNDRELAQFKNRDCWECKVGRTEGEVDARILDQGARTALSRQPVVGLVIRTDRCVDVERALHAALRHGGAGVSAGGGSEWFLTSPDRIERWYNSFVEASSELTKGVG